MDTAMSIACAYIDPATQAPPQQCVGARGCHPGGCAAKASQPITGRQFMKETRPSWRVPLLAAAVSLIGGVATVAVAQGEDFASLVKRLSQEKPQFAKRQQDLLAQRYDLADRPTPGV